MKYRYHYYMDEDSQKPRHIINRYGKQFKKACRYLGVKGKTLHFLRHTYANSLNKFFFIFNPILISIILIISVLVRLIKLKKNVTDEDVMNNINPTSVA